MTYNIGIANIAHTCEGQSYGVHPLYNESTQLIFVANDGKIWVVHEAVPLD